MATSDYVHSLLTTQVAVSLRQCAHQPLDDVILGKVKRVEGTCISEGYIKAGSVKIVSRSLGRTTMYNNAAQIYYTVRYSADVCNPQVNDVVECRAEKMNKIGILAVGVHAPLKIIVARQHHASGTYDETVRIGDVFRVRVCGVRFNIHEKKIQVIAKFISSGQ